LAGFVHMVVCSHQTTSP